MYLASRRRPGPTDPDGSANDSTLVGSDIGTVADAGAHDDTPDAPHEGRVEDPRATVLDAIDDVDAVGPGRGATGRGPVLALGLTSFFTDISSEMVAAILPLYLVVHVGFDVGSYGAFDGALAAATLVLLLAGGALADRWRRPKPVAFCGYGLSALTRAGLLLGSAPVAFLLVDRVGKGLRVAPRDMLISLHAPPGGLSTAYATHRALDTAGALIGPLLAFGVLQIVPGDFDLVFGLSLLTAVVGLAVLALGVPGGPLAAGPATTTTTDTTTKATDTDANRPTRRLRLRDIDGAGDVGRLSAAGGLLGLTTVSDGLLYLALWRTAGLDAATFPLLFVGTALSYLVAVFPIGILADRVGRVRLLIPAHVPLLAIYLLLWWSSTPSTAMVVACLVAHGVYYAMTDGVYAAAAAAVTPASIRGRGIGAVTFGVATGRFVASLVFGALWLRLGLDDALAVATAGLLVALAVARILLFPVRRRDTA
jgi:MFS family permease